MKQGRKLFDMEAALAERDEGRKFETREAYLHTSIRIAGVDVSGLNRFGTKVVIKEALKGANLQQAVATAKKVMEKKGEPRG